VLQAGFGLPSVAAAAHAVSMGELVDGALHPGADRVAGLPVGCPPLGADADSQFRCLAVRQTEQELRHTDGGRPGGREAGAPVAGYPSAKSSSHRNSSGERPSDRVTVGVLTQAFPQSLVDEVPAETGRGQRVCRTNGSSKIFVGVDRPGRASVEQDDLAQEACAPTSFNAVRARPCQRCQRSATCKRSAAALESCAGNAPSALRAAQRTSSSGRPGSRSTAATPKDRSPQAARRLTRPRRDAHIASAPGPCPGHTPGTHGKHHPW
jgi:hypothetical protein